MAALPARPLRVGAGVLFIGFGLWTLREPGNDADDEAAADRQDDGHGPREDRGRGPLLVTYLSFLAAEFGDKTMLATITLATTAGRWSPGSVRPWA